MCTCSYAIWKHPYVLGYLGSPSGMSPKATGYNGDSGCLWGSWKGEDTQLGGWVTSDTLYTAWGLNLCVCLHELSVLFSSGMYDRINQSLLQGTLSLLIHHWPVFGCLFVLSFGWWFPWCFPTFIRLLRSSKLPSPAFIHFDWCVIFHGANIPEFIHLLSCWWACGLFPGLCHVYSVTLIYDLSKKCPSFLSECPHWLNCRWLRDNGTRLSLPSSVRDTVEPHAVLIFANQVDIWWYFTMTLHCPFVQCFSKKCKIIHVFHKCDSNWLSWFRFSKALFYYFTLHALTIVVLN